MGILTAFLPILALGLAIAFFASRDDFRIAILKAYVSWGIWIVCLTTILSCFKILNSSNILYCWIGVTVLLICSIARHGALKFVAEAKENACQLKKLVSEWSWLGIALSVLIAGSFITMAFSVPNAWDSMTYHLPRVMMWLQNECLAPYPTQILRQLWMCPGNDYAILQFFALSDNDTWTLVPSWISMAISLVAVSALARELGGSRHAQFFSVVLLSTLPLGLSLASSGLDLYSETSWLIVTSVFLLRLSKNLAAVDVLFAGFALGLATLTKGTAYIFGASLFSFVFAHCLLQRKKEALISMCAVPPLAAVVNLYFFTQNIFAFGSPLGPRVETADYSNASMDVATFTSNSLRFVSLQLATSSNAVNACIESTVVWLHRALGLDASDPHTTFWMSPHYSIGLMNTDSFTSCPIHFLMILFTIFSFCFVSISKRKLENKLVLTYMLSLSFAFAGFCLYVKWQLWGNRLLFPLFVLWLPFAALQLDTTRPEALKPLAKFLVACAFPWILLDVNRPLFSIPNLTKSIFYSSPADMYFIQRRQLRNGFLAGSEFLAKRKSNAVGLICDYDSWEYPLWALMRRKNGSCPKVIRLSVQNLSKNFSQAEINPDCTAVLFDMADIKFDPSSIKGPPNQTLVESSSPVLIYCSTKSTGP